VPLGGALSSREDNEERGTGGCGEQGRGKEYLCFTPAAYFARMCRLERTLESRELADEAGEGPMYAWLSVFSCQSSVFPLDMRAGPPRAAPFGHPKGATGQLGRICRTED
jgi:hypothetical protein